MLTSDLNVEKRSLINSGNAWCRAVQNLLSTPVISKSLEIKICRTNFDLFPRCETSFFAPKEEHRLGVFENRVLRRIFERKRDEVKEGWRKLLS
jgi:hypothetical protein